MTKSEIAALKSKVYTLGEKAIVYGRRMRICEELGRELSDDGIAKDVKADMEVLEKEIYAALDSEGNK